MRGVKFISAGFTTELNRRIEDDKHRLWGSQSLLLNVNEEINTHREFLRCGVDILLTNTYQASIAGFQKYLGLDEKQSYDLIKKSVTHCKEAIKLEKEAGVIDSCKNILIAGSVGSFGAFLSDGSEYTGTFLENHSLDEIEALHRSKIQALVEAGVDYLAFETIPSILEAKILVKILIEYPHMKGWLSFSAKDEIHTGYGEKFSEIASQAWLLSPSQLIAVGVNCIGAKISMQLVSSLKNVPIIVYPNCGKVWDAQRKEWLNSNNETHFYDDLIYQWCEMGVKFIGLCCGATMESRIRAIKIIHKFFEDGKTNNSDK